MPNRFAYLGVGLRRENIAAFVARYTFGTIQPDSVVFHHTAKPWTSWAPIKGGAPKDQWDRGEAGLSESDIYAKRLGQLGNLRNYYRDTLGWSAGPHAFIDERWVWLMSPMEQPGIHAKWFNSYRVGGRLHYSIGIEMLGNFSAVRWHPMQAALAATFVQALQRTLGTFAIEQMYTPATSPGMVVVNKEQRCAHPERLRWGGITSHRYSNKPECPGNAISDQYMIDVLRSGDAPAVVAPVAPVAPADDLPAGGRFRVIADTLNVRDRPALRGSRVVGQLARGRVITVDVCKHDEAGDATTWAHMDRFTNPEGDLGFLSLRYLERIP